MLDGCRLVGHKGRELFGFAPFQLVYGEAYTGLLRRNGMEPARVVAERYGVDSLCSRGVAA